MVRSKHQFCSCLFEITYVDGLPIIQSCHLRILGTDKDVKIHDDSNVGDFTLKDCFDLVDGRYDNL